MDKPTYLYLCRHGQSQYNDRGLLQGQIDNPLTALGKEQALALAHRAKGWDIKHLVSSPLSRAQQTAELCAQVLGLTVDVKTGFEERHFGKWQGLRLSTLNDYQGFRQRCYKQIDLIPCEGAEATFEVRDRMLSQLKSIAKQTRNNVLLVSHGDAINCLLSIWEKPTKINNCQAVRLIKKADNFVLDMQ